MPPKYVPSLGGVAGGDPVSRPLHPVRQRAIAWRRRRSPLGECTGGSWMASEWRFDGPLARGNTAKTPDTDHGRGLAGLKRNAKPLAGAPTLSVVPRQPSRARCHMAVGEEFALRTRI